MARLNPKVARQVGIKKQNLGKVIIFCEGTTEANYFNYFANHFKRNKYSEIEIVCEKANGNAQTVLDHANEFLDKDSNISFYSNWGKYLVFDCDDPDNIQEVMMKMIESDRDYKLFLSNYLFETWLLMHFEIVEEKLKKAKIYNKMADYLRVEKYNSKVKADKGIMAKIIGDLQPVRYAIENARSLEEKYKSEGLSVKSDIDKMNTYTTVHKLMEEILSEI